MRSVLFLVLAALGAGGCALHNELERAFPEELEAVPDQRVAVSAVLETFHRAAAEADGDAYFGLLAPKAVFLGTDATERWSKSAFEDYCRPYFEAGTGWTYTAEERNVELAGDVAWADELLWNDKYGRCRGTAVLRRHDRRWLIEHYSLTLLVPNELAGAVVETIRAGDSSDD